MNEKIIFKFTLAEASIQTVYAHNHTGTAESTMQGDNQLIRSSERLAH
jgi:hypothetical protein